MKREVSLTNSETIALDEIREILGERPILAERLRSELFANSPLDTTDSSERDRILSIISVRLNDEMFSAEELAGSVGVSRSSLERVCRKVFGLTPGSLIRLVRLEVAAELLATSELDISQVAFEIGYSGVSQFTRAFRQCYGTTPTHWRERGQRFRSR